eukprot:SAG11_NODE_2784_length_2976_cov_2.710115_1_plen_391_part_00
MFLHHGSRCCQQQRAAALCRGLGFLEQAEASLARTDPSALDCDWMLGAAITRDAYRVSSPQISARAAEMAERLLARCAQRWSDPRQQAAVTASRPTPAVLRRAVLDCFGAARVHAQPSPAAHGGVELCNRLLRRLEEEQRGAAMPPSLFAQLFGFCPVRSPPPLAASTGPPPGARLRWANGLIFARMAADLRLRDGPAPATALPSYGAVLGWVRAALPPQSVGRDAAFFDGRTTLARQLRQEELYLRTHLVYTSTGYRHVATAAAMAPPHSGGEGAAFEDSAVLERLLRTLVREAREATAAPISAEALRAAARRPDMMGEALDCIKALDSADGTCAPGREVHEAEELLLSSQAADGGWPHDEGRRHHSTFVAIWGLREVCAVGEITAWRV